MILLCFVWEFLQGVLGFSGSVLQLSYKPLIRDTCFYAGSIGLIFICLLEEPDAGEGNALVTWWEALILVSGYVAYIVFMKFNEKICGTTSDTVKVRCRLHDPHLSLRGPRCARCGL